MNVYDPNVKTLQSIVGNLYHAVNGKKPDEAMKERLHAGVKGMVDLYKENPPAFYALAAVAVLEGTERLELKSLYGGIILKYLAQSMVEESRYAPKKDDNEDLGGQ